MIHYEDLKKDPRSEILRLGKFLGEDIHKSLLEEGMIEKIVQNSHVDTMKKHYEKFEMPIEGVDNPGESQCVSSDRLERCVSR